MNTYPTQAEGDRDLQGTSACPAPDELGDAVSVFIEARPGLLKIAHRILGDAGDAEDVIQETWLRWQGTDRTVVLNPAALLRTTTVRLAINVVHSARRRRESSASLGFPSRPTPRAPPKQWPSGRTLLSVRSSC